MKLLIKEESMFVKAVYLLALVCCVKALEPESKDLCQCKCSNGHNGLNGRDGKDGAKGERGEPGPPGTPGLSPSTGNIIFVEDSGQCDNSVAGKVKYNPNESVLEMCNGKAWLPLAIGSGISRTSAAKSCLEIKKTGSHHVNDLYWLDPNGGSKDDAFEAFCDMETEGGGWTLVATKATPTFIFIKGPFSARAARSTLDDAASCIHPNMDAWTEVMFRFADRNDIRVIYNRAGGGSSTAKTNFDNYLMGQTATLLLNTAGFYKHSPAENSGQRTPSSGFETIVRFHYYSSSGISEDHSGTDRWIDLWNSVDGSNKYISSDDPAARGQKCIAGYCYLNTPVWVMVR